MRIAYPAARRSAASYLLHGNNILEPYDWLEDPAGEECKSFVSAQNSAFEQYMASAKDLRSKLFSKITAMQDYSRTSVVSHLALGYFYYHNTGLQNQSVLFQATSLRDDKPKIFLDPNVLSQDGTTALKTGSWNESESQWAYSVSEKGSDWQRIHVRDGKSAKDLPDTIEWAKFTGISWLGDIGFFYTRYPTLEEVTDKGAETDTAENPFICFHRIGTQQEADIEIFRLSEHPRYSIGCEVTDDKEHLIVSIHDGCEPNNLIWIAKFSGDSIQTGITASTPALQFHKVVNTFVGDYSYLGNNGDSFFFTTTRNAPRKKLVTLDLSTGIEEDLIPEKEAVLTHAALVRDTLLLVYLEDVKDVLYYRTLTDSTTHRLDLPIGSIGSLSARRKNNLVSLKISSFLLPGRSYVFDIQDPKGTLEVFREDKVEGLDPEQYETVQKFYESHDGTRIPMFIVYKKGCASPKSPLLLYGYGGFNISLTPSFSPSRVVFLEHLNGILAIPNIRGGGEYGQSWHDAGRREHKQNCFSDFIAAAKFLHAEGFGSPDTTAIVGGSNGGLLVAATELQAPDLFKCVVCQVGVLDMYKFHKFTIGHAWISDYGNPDVEEDFKVLAKYSPLHSVRSGTKYPPTLVVTGDHDDRVVPLHSLKYVATLQHANPELGGPFLARIDLASGHGAGKPTSKRLEEAADIYAFLSKTVGAQWKN